jgi:hypothetical protein
VTPWARSKPATGESRPSRSCAPAGCGRARPPRRRRRRRGRRGRRSRRGRRGRRRSRPRSRPRRRSAGGACPSRTSCTRRRAGSASPAGTAHPTAARVTPKAHIVCRDREPAGTRPARRRDRDAAFSRMYDGGVVGVGDVRTPVRAPRANAFAERRGVSVRRQWATHNTPPGRTERSDCDRRSGHLPRCRQPRGGAAPFPARRTAARVRARGGVRDRVAGPKGGEAYSSLPPPAPARAPKRCPEGAETWPYAQTSRTS